MAERKTKATKASVPAFLRSLSDPQRRADATVLDKLMRQATGARPVMWGPSIVGYGDWSYRDSRGKEVAWFPAGFASRQAGLTLYLLGGFKPHAALLKSLGRHKVSGACLHIPKLAEVDTTVLTQMVQRALSAATNASAPTAATSEPRKRAV
jgi:hypothetical protein